jgi:hypothetical protein
MLSIGQNTRRLVRHSLPPRNLEFGIRGRSRSRGLALRHGSARFQAYQYRLAKVHQVLRFDDNAVREPRPTRRGSKPARINDRVNHTIWRAEFFALPLTFHFHPLPLLGAFNRGQDHGEAVNIVRGTSFGRWTTVESG